MVSCVKITINETNSYNCNFITIIKANQTRSPLLLACFVGICLWTTVISLKICAFNIQSYGETKASNKRVMEILIKIISRCDLSLIQEVRDSRGEAIAALMINLNRYERSHIYSHLESKRMGKKTYKEQYVYIYRKDMLQVQDQYHHPKSNETAAESEVFTREPFIIRIRSPTTLVKNFVLIGHHTCPKTAMKEMDALYEVFQTVRKKWKAEEPFPAMRYSTDNSNRFIVCIIPPPTGHFTISEGRFFKHNVMFLGDLNAACSYVTKKGLRNVRIRNDPKFQWLIRDEQDTTVRDKTHCAYDRIIIHGKELISGIVPESAQPFNFKQAFGLSEEEALEVSDHYPVEVDLKPNHRYLLRHEL